MEQLRAAEGYESLRIIARDLVASGEAKRLVELGARAAGAKLMGTVAA